MTGKEFDFSNIDWALLREQKKTLLEVLNKKTLTTDESRSLDGILHLIDSIQDHAVDNLEISENVVFGWTLQKREE